MPQKLSAMNYIKNNKRRTAVLIVSLGLCFVLTYLTQFLLSSSEETMHVIFVDRIPKIQFVHIAPETFGLDTENTDYGELAKIYLDENRKLAEKLKKHDGIKEIYCSQIYYCTIGTAISSTSYSIPMVSKEEVPKIMENMGAKLIDGRMPENPGEMVLDKATMKNNEYELNGYFDEKYYEDQFKIVGILDCDVYFGCGVAVGGSVDEGGMGALTIFSEGIEDLTAELAEEGITVGNDDLVRDIKWGKEFMQKEITDAFDNATKYVYAGILILLSISLIIVYTMYLRDRHNEWCLYSSIGYSRKTIYFSIMRELLFTFVTAILSGGIIIAVSVIILNSVMVEPKGLRCRYFSPDTLLEIFCSYALIMGILQMPIRYALNRIRTIDAMDDDLH